MDTIKAYAYDAVAYLAGEGVLNGVGNNTFAPQKAVTRAEAAMLIQSLAKGVR